MYRNPVTFFLNVLDISVEKQFRLNGFQEMTTKDWKGVQNFSSYISWFLISKNGENIIFPQTANFTLQ